MTTTTQPIDQAEALAVRDAAEAAARPMIAKQEKALAASRAAAVKAVADAQRALLEMVAAINVHNLAVKDTARQLLDAGLSVTSAEEHADGATVAGEVRLSGAWWLLLNPATAFHRTTRAALTAAFSRPDLVMVKSSALPAAFVALIPALPVTSPPRPHQRWGVQGGGAPVGLRDDQREQSAKDRLVETVTFKPWMPAR